MPVRSFALAFLLAAFGAFGSACASPEADPEAVALVPEADVARAQAQTFVATQAIDAEIASVEAEAAAADSLRQGAYAPVLERLRQDRRRLQVRVDSLAPLPRTVFDTTLVAIARQTDRLRASVAQARFDAASDPESLQQAAARRLAAFDRRLAGAGPRATADTTGRLRTALDSLAAQRQRLDARLVAFADTTAPAFRRLRRATMRDAAALDGRLARLVPDSTAAERRESQ